MIALAHAEGNLLFTVCIAFFVVAVLRSAGDSRPAAYGKRGGSFFVRRERLPIDSESVHSATFIGVNESQFFEALRTLSLVTTSGPATPLNFAEGHYKGLPFLAVLANPEGQSARWDTRRYPLLPGPMALTQLKMGKEHDEALFAQLVDDVTAYCREQFEADKWQPSTSGRSSLFTKLFVIALLALLVAVSFIAKSHCAPE